MRQIRTALSVAAGIIVLSGPAAAQEQTKTPSADRAAPLSFDLADRQRRAILSMPSAEVTYHPGGTVRSVRGETGIAISSAARALRNGESGKDVLAALRNVVVATGQEELTVINNASTFPTERALNFSQSIAGIPVIGGGLGMVVDTSSGLVKVLNSQFLPDRNLPRVPKLSRAQAKAAASKALYTFFAALPESVGFFAEPITLAYVGRSDAAQREALVWVVGASYLTNGPAGHGGRNIWIDAVTGEYVGSESLISHLQRTAYSANNAEVPLNTLPNGLVLLFSEGNATGDAMATSAYSKVFDAEHAWTSEVGPAPVSTFRLVVHYKMPPNRLQSDAFYWPLGSANYLVFGNGDATARSPALDKEIVAHEYGHAIYKRHYPQLIIDDTESSAMTEAHGDFVAVLVGKGTGGVAAPSTWQIGPQFFDASKFLRSWRNPVELNAVEPGFYWYPKAFRASQWDHETSTIIGHWFYLLSQGGQNAMYGFDLDVPLVPVAGRGFDIAKFIFHNALLAQGLQGSPSLRELRTATESAASLLSADTLASTRAAWNAVGVGWNCSGPPARPDLILRDRCAGRWVLNWPSVPNATTYYGEAVPDGWPWSLSTPIIEGNLNTCHQTIRSNFWVRLKACNGCGCSEFTVPQEMTYFPGQCP